MVQITKYSEKRMYTGTFNCQRMVCHIHDYVVQMLQLIYYVGEYTIQVRYVVDYIGFCKKLSLWTVLGTYRQYKVEEEIRKSSHSFQTLLHMIILIYLILLHCICYYEYIISSMGLIFL